MSDRLQAFEIGATIVPVKRQQSPAQIANLRKFEKGRSGNPKGRARGSRNKLAEEFFDAMLDVWREKGADCLREFASLDPVAYVKLHAEIHLKHSGDLNLSPEEIKMIEDHRAMARKAVDWVKAGG